VTWAGDHPWYPESGNVKRTSMEDQPSRNDWQHIGYTVSRAHVNHGMGTVRSGCDFFGASER
jgi:hypothetical protein